MRETHTHPDHSYDIFLKQYLTEQTHLRKSYSAFSHHSVTCNYYDSYTSLIITPRVVNLTTTRGNKTILRAHMN
jgi:hypothetical protein